MSGEFAERVIGRLERLDLSPDAVARKARLPSGLMETVLAGGTPPRGRRLQALADALECSIAYLVGLDPDAEPPADMLEEDQGNLGLLAGDEEALLIAYRVLDVSSKAALLRVASKMADPKGAA